MLHTKLKDWPVGAATRGGVLTEAEQYNIERLVTNLMKDRAPAGTIVFAVEVNVAFTIDMEEYERVHHELAQEQAEEDADEAAEEGCPPDCDCNGK